MKVTKLVVGILQILIAVVILVQSCSVGASHAMEDKTSDFGGTFGIIAAILFLATGIVYIATRKSKKTWWRYCWINYDVNYLDFCNY